MHRHDAHDNSGSQASKPGWRGLRCSLTVALLSLVGGQLALATGPNGPIGPQGKIGPRTAEDAEAAQNPGRAARTPAQAPMRADSAPGNRITVTNNTATNVRCAGDGSVSVNSVDVNGASLKGRTVIVQGHNATDVRSEDCAGQSDGGAQGPGSVPSQVNSIRIR
ncbi:hypothetical protein [Diaphorobacter aerolatus]|uniref:Uncharacterized protein n=1 Tax=Diaphorobacter aerolatus TaxID=1288495 RepID=A0A7H0GMF7_9BURK|nr:hypothetical protein [Diaphorobacter aerolatus]QNP49473.1 hypothetical protein H9K75_05510 [Diaphorobacter aerolatus]